MQEKTVKKQKECPEILRSLFGEEEKVWDFLVLDDLSMEDFAKKIEELVGGSIEEEILESAFEEYKSFSK